MMLNHIPDSIEIIDYKDDGKDTRHYRFRLLSKTQHSHWHETQAGQFFMLNVPEVGEAPFTFTEPPNEQNEFSALIRKMASVTSALFDLSKGQIVGARGPFGQGWPHTTLKDEYTSQNGNIYIHWKFLLRKKKKYFRNRNFHSYFFR